MSAKEPETVFASDAYEAEETARMPEKEFAFWALLFSVVPASVSCGFGWVWPVDAAVGLGGLLVFVVITRRL